MTSPITINHQVFIDSLGMVSQLDEHTNWDQTEGVYSPDKERCCIGAHIAKHFNVRYNEFEDGEYYYEDAITFLCNSMDMDRNELNSLLHVCGAPSLPFSTLRWINTPPGSVWKNVLMVEKILDRDKLIELASDDEVVFDKTEITVEKYPANIIDDYEMFNGVLEFNDSHPKFNI